MKGNIDTKKYICYDDNGVKVVVSNFWENCESKLGTYMEDTDYDFVVEEDTDFYAPLNDQLVEEGISEKNIIFKFRKGSFTEEEQLGAYDGLMAAAQPTQNRGVAAGPKGEKLQGRDWVTNEQIEIMEAYIQDSNNLFGEDVIEKIINKYKTVDNVATRGLVWLRNKVTEDFGEYDGFFDKLMIEWKSMSSNERIEYIKNVKKKYISDTTYANAVNSGIAGFFDRYPRIPYGRATSYTEKNRELYEKCYPFMRKLSNEFKRLLPNRYAVQEDYANKIDPRFRVAGKDTPFTTITVNKNFRTAAHRDAGDLHEGFSNLTVVAKDKEWRGGYLVLPEFRVAVNIRPGDLLLINNHTGIHGNTELFPPEGKPIEEMERISLVCYFREKMLELGSWEYEQHRYEFVESRRLNKDHPMWKPLWNGVSPGMWEDQEWFDYLKTVGGESMLNQYHPKQTTATSLEDFFA